MSDSEAESELSRALHLAHETVQAELQKLLGTSNVEIGKKLHESLEQYFNSTVHLREPFTGPRFIALASGSNRAARRGAMGHSVGYPVQTGNRAMRRAWARKTWRQAKIKEIREAHKKAIEEKAR